MASFTENTRVQIPATLHLCKLGYVYLDRIENFNSNTNILTEVFLRSIKRLNPELSERECSLLLGKIVGILNNDDLGQEFYSILSSNSGIKLIDYGDPHSNEWHVTTEFSYENPESGDIFRPDITCFVNGLPLAFIEVKKPNNHDGILAEKERIMRRMKNKRFRQFFNITQLMIFSNNQEYDGENRIPIQGAFYCCSSKDIPFFNVFREPKETFIANYPYLDLDESQEKKVLKNCMSLKGLKEYETNKDVNTPTNRILTSMLSKERFLYLLRYGFAYVNRSIELEDGSKSTRLEKHVMRYQQLFASLSICDKLKEGVKSGIIWHTQGSGKTALAYYSVRSLVDYYSTQQTAVKFYFIVDRIALMEQASDEFASRGLVVRTVNSRDELMEDLKSNAPIENNEGRSEITVVNIQKFKEDNTKVKIDSGYNTRLQRVFFIDEAHRGYSPEGSFLANLLEADKDSVKIALTGTPLLKNERESWRVFGDYIDTYYYDKSIADGYTLKLMREPIETIYKERIESILERLAGDVEVKKRDVDKDNILEHENYLNALLDYIISDFRRFRIEKDDESVGAMIVCRTNRQARELFRLWQERFTQAKKIEVNREEQLMQVAEPMLVYGNRKPLRASLILHDEGDKLERKAYIEEYKKQQSIDVLIVNQMLLTGFDAPRLKKLYLGRALDGHDLLQALTRVNRPYKDFKYGYVVDFVDIKENFDSTNNRYLHELNRTVDEDERNISTPVGSTIIVDKNDIIDKIHSIRSVLFDYTCSNPEEFRKEVDSIDNKETLYELRNTLKEAKAISNQIRAFGDEELKRKAELMLISGVPTLISEVTRRIERINLFENTEHKADVSSIINIALSELEFEFKKGVSEELRIIVNDIKERCERVQAEFQANFDKAEEKYVLLSEEFNSFFREKGFIPKSTEEAKLSIGYMDAVMKKIQEINRRNNVLKKKYKGDEKFVRIHKRINEENKKRVCPVISVREYEIVEGLSRMKSKIDNQVFLNENILENEEAFKRDLLAIVGNELYELGIESELKDRNYINNLISSEYLHQRNAI